ncbi:MAG: hypothetical protein WC538_07820 [Thermoanaerobaculia bacterium]|jgi:hypothetical protein
MSDGTPGYALVPDEARHILRVSCAGMLDVPLARAMITEARLAAAEGGLSLLYDFTGVTLSAKVTDLFEFPKSLEVYREARTLSIPVAIVVPVGRDAGFWKFYVDAATRAGHTIKAFHAEGDAVAWLSRLRAEG